MATSHKIFLDVSVFEAFIDRSSTLHTRSVDLLSRLAREQYIVFTSQEVVEEVYQLVERKISKTIAVEFLQAITESSIEVLFPLKGDLVSCHRLIMENKEKRVGMREAVTAVLMKRAGVSYIATFGFWGNMLGTVPY